MKTRDTRCTHSHAPSIRSPLPQKPKQPQPRKSGARIKPHRANALMLWVPRNRSSAPRDLLRSIHPVVRIKKSQFYAGVRGGRDNVWTG